MADHDPARRADRLALAACLGAGFATLLDQAVVSYTVPSLSTELHAPTGAVQWFLAVYSLTFGIGLVPGGRLGDAFGRRGLFVGGLALFAVGALAAVLAPTIGWAIVGRSVQGFGAGVVSAQVLGVIQDLFRDRERVRALAAYGAAASASAIVGPLAAAGVLAVAPPSTAWRFVLAISLPWVLATGLLALRSVPARQPEERRRPVLDVPGIVLTALLVVLVTVPVIDPGVGSGVITAVVLGVVGTVLALVWWERRARGPLFAPALVRSGGFVRGNAVAAMWFGAGVAQSSVVTVFLLQGFGLVPLVVALVLAPGAAARIAGSWASTRAHARFGRRLLPVCLAVQGSGLVALAVAVGALDGVALFATVLGVELVVGASSGVFEPAMRHTTLQHALPGGHGLAASFLQLTQRLAATFCVALVTGVSFAGGTGVTVTPGGMRAALVVCAVLLAGSFAASVVPRGVTRRRRTQQTIGDGTVLPRVAPDGLREER